jgi:hypothetical protein
MLAGCGLHVGAAVVTLAVGAADGEDATGVADCPGSEWDLGSAGAGPVGFTVLDANGTGADAFAASDAALASA